MTHLLSESVKYVSQFHPRKATKTTKHFILEISHKMEQCHSVFMAPHITDPSPLHVASRSWLVKSRISSNHNLITMCNKIS